MFKKQEHFLDVLSHVLFQFVFMLGGLKRVNSALFFLPWGFGMRDWSERPLLWGICSLRGFLLSGGFLK